jgi:hypothetical protein
MMLPNTKNILIIGAFVALGGLAVAGWVRKNDRSVVNPVVAMQPDPYAAPNSAQPVAGTYAQPQQGYPQQNYPQQGYAQQGYPQQNYAQGTRQPVYTSDGYYPSRARPVYIRQQPAYVDQPASVQRREVVQQEYYTDTRGRRRSRSKAHSVEIVAGTAAAGAVIGALAGGGKGAAIGGASGAGAGFLYDRLTHNH